MKQGLLRLIFTSMAYLPWAILYILADLIYLIAYYIVRYRRTVVRCNLINSFPDLPDDEITRIERRFYRNFADYIVETVKLLHISDSEMAARMQFKDVEILDTLTGQGRSVAIYFSHCGNWEWAPSVTLHAAKDPRIVYCQVYRPLKDKAFDSLMLGLRARFGSVSLPKATVLRSLLQFRKEDKVSVTGFMSDQKPSHGDPTTVCDFLGQETHFISGTETLARRLGMAAVYWDMEKISRGHYRITCRLMSEDASALPPQELTHIYARMLQNTIERNPSIWLWTHKRWKKV